MEPEDFPKKDAPSWHNLQDSQSIQLHALWSTDRDLDRLKALSDGVFSIVMTLLVFDLRPPDINATEDLWKAIASLLPNIGAFIVSFALIGVYWVGHRNMFHHIQRMDHEVCWLNILVLLLVSLLPVSSRLIGRYPGEPAAIIVYGVNLILIGLSLGATWIYASWDKRLVDPSISDAVVLFALSRCFFAPACYLVAVLLANHFPTISILIYAIVPVIYVVPVLQRHWMKLAVRLRRKKHKFA